eukprot:scaffold15458_cov53-Prasinocladus_malaysianus.AAC.1
MHTTWFQYEIEWFTCRLYLSSDCQHAVTVASEHFHVTGRSRALAGHRLWAGFPADARPAAFV